MTKKKVFIILIAFLVVGLTMGVTTRRVTTFSSAIISPSSSSSDDPSFRVNNTSGTSKFQISAAGVVTAVGAQTITGTVSADGFSLGDDDNLTLGSSSDWTLNFDDSVDDQLILLTAGTTAIADTDPMFEIITGASMDADQEVFGVSKGTQASNTELLTLDEDGDLVVTGTTTCTSHLVLGDDIQLQMGATPDWMLEYDEGVDDQLLWLTAGTGCTATTDPMFEILVGATPTADQQVFGIGKGTQASNTALLTLDEDGDLDVAGIATVAGLSNLNAGIAVDTSAFTVADATGNTLIAGSLDANGGIACDTSAFTVADTTGNTVIAGSLSANGGIACDTTAFTVADTSGNVATTGSLSVTGSSSLTGGVVITDDVTLAMGHGSDWTLEYDEGVDDQLLWLTAGTGAAATTDPMFEVLVGATPDR